MRCYEQHNFISCLALDSTFEYFIRGIWSQFKDVADFNWSEFNFSDNSLLVRYATGHYAPCSWAFVDVDYLLLPMFLPTAEHWILGYVSFIEMELQVYNSVVSEASTAEVEDVVRGMATILPHLLKCVGFFSGRQSPCLNSQYQIGQPFVVSFPETPQQKNKLVRYPFL